MLLLLELQSRVCLCPLTVTLLNTDRYKVGKTAIGFLNPTIYINGSKYFTDVTNGENSCCASKAANGGTIFCCAAGFSATKGW